VPGRGLSIALVMRLTALVALNLAVLRLMPVIPESPPFLFALVVLDIVLVQAVALGRPLRAFHYTFLIVGVLSTGLITALAFRDSRPVIGSLHILETIIQWHRAARGETGVVSPHMEFPRLASAERWVTGTIGLVPAWAAGVIVSRRMRQGRPPGRRGRDIVAFLQGALIGLGFFAAGSTLAFGFGFGPPVPHTAGWHALRAALATCPILGGTAVAVWTRLKSRRLERGATESHGDEYAVVTPPAVSPEL